MKISQKTCKTVRLVYGWVFSAFTFVLGALFIWQILDIYLGGMSAGNTSPFSYELVASRLSKIIAVPFWIWIAAIIAGFVLWEVFPVKERLKPVTDARYILSRLEKRIPTEVDEKLQYSVQCIKEQQRTIRMTHYWFTGGVAVLFLIYVIAYVANSANFPNVDKTEEMLNMALYILPVAAIVFVAGCIYVTLLNRTAKKMLPNVKKLTEGVKAPQTAENKFTKIVTHKYFILGVRIAVACFGVAFVIAGMAVNDFASVKEVFNKAIRICTECIGLG